MEKMTKEEKFIKIHRVIWVLITAIFILLPITIVNTSQATIVYDELLIDDSSTYSTRFDLYIEFDRYVYSGSATVALYDASYDLISVENVSFYADDKVAETTFYVYESADFSSYEILNCEVQLFLISPYFLYSFLLIPLTMLICSFVLKYKETVYENKKISIYSGFFNSYIKIDNEICDKYCGFNYGALYLDATLEDGTYIEVRISSLNMITLKINNKLIRL